MKQQNIFLSCILFSFLPAPFLIGIFNDSPGGAGALWDLPSFIIVYVVAVLLFLVTFNYIKKSSKKFFIYKLIWLQELFILLGLTGTAMGFTFGLAGMEIDLPSGVDPTASLISSMAVALLTLIYGFWGALTIYLIQKFYEMKWDEMDDVEVEKPKEGFLISSLFYFLLFLVLEGFTLLYLGTLSSGVSIIVSIESFIYIFTLLVIFLSFYKGKSFINLIKNLFWYVSDTEKNIEYNLKFIRNMKKVAAMLICVSLLCAPIVILVSLSMPPANNNVGWNNLPFIGIKNGGVQFLWILEIIFLLIIIEGREVSKLYFITGKINAGDRFYSIKYILAPAFLLFFTFIFCVLTTFLI